jgi:hypothetical protein
MLDLSIGSEGFFSQAGTIVNGMMGVIVLIGGFAIGRKVLGQVWETLRGLADVV